MGKITMYEIILRHLRDYGSITSWEAIQEYGCTRLSQYILMLRQNGYNIENERINTKNRYGMPTNYVKYRLREEVEQVG